MPDLSITCRYRRGRPADAPALSAFAARMFAESFGAENRPEDMQAHLSASYTVDKQTTELSSDTVKTILGTIDDELTAYAQVRQNTPPGCVAHARAIELYRFYVDKSAHGRGIAQSLMQEVFEAAREFDGLHLWLSVWERNPRAIAFYRKFNFQAVGTADFFVGPDRQTDKIMVARLPESA